MKPKLFSNLLSLAALWFAQNAISQTQIEETYAIKMAESVMARHNGSYGGWNYETGTVLRGFEMLYGATGDQRFYNYIKNTVDGAVNSGGTISGYAMSDYNIDEIKQGSLVLYLYSVTGDSRYKTAADTLMQQLRQQPRTSDGGNWHKNKYPYQMWLDGLYMGQPFNAQYGALFNAAGNFDDAVLQLSLMEKHARDTTSGLLYHGWDESGAASWANPATHTSSEFWGRSLGWYAMALVDVLDYIPAQNTEQRNAVIAILQRFAAGIRAVQDSSTWVWWQVANKAGQSGNWNESSASAMFVYSLAKGVRKGYLDTSYLTVAENGWVGLVNEFVTVNSNGTLNLTQTCEGTSVGDYSYYINRGRLTNDPKGIGPFLMAAVEMELLRSPLPLPVVVSPIADMNLFVGDSPVTIDLATVFNDPDGDELFFSHSASDANDQNVRLNGSLLTINPQAIGTVTHTITADDLQDGRVSDSFVVKVQSTEAFSLEIQAETQTWSAGTVDSNYTGYTGTGFVNTDNILGASITFAFDVPFAGDYEILIRYANGSTDRSQRVELNGVTVISAMSFPGSGGWSTWTEQAFTASLPAGKNILTLVSLTTGGAPNIDRISVLYAGDSGPTPTVTPTATPTASPTATPTPTPTPRPTRRGRTTPTPVPTLPTVTPTPTPTVTSVPTVTPTPTPAVTPVQSGYCEYVIADDWGTGFTASIVITNRGSSAINGWQVNWRYSGATRISGLWNATLSGSNPYSASNLNWNGNLAPGQSVSFGFQGTKPVGAAEIPLLQGAVCQQ